MNIRLGFWALSLVLWVPASYENELKPETLKAWEEYVQAANAQFRERLNQGSHFLRVEQEPDRVSSLIQGQILVEPVGRNGRENVTHGWIHDWFGGVFVPGANIEDVLSVLGDYDRYQDFFHPAVVDSKLLERAGDNEKFSLLMLSKVLFVTVALDGQYESHLACLEEKLHEKRCYIISHSVRTQQIKDYGRPSERALPPGEGHRYLWRLNGITSFEERDGGVLIENESIGLSRDIPVSVRRLVDPPLRPFPRNSRSTALRPTPDTAPAPRALS